MLTFMLTSFDRQSIIPSESNSMQAPVYTAQTGHKLCWFYSMDSGCTIGALLLLQSHNSANPSSLNFIVVNALFFSVSGLLSMFPKTCCIAKERL